MTGNVCPECGQHIRQTHKEVLNKHKLTMLKAAASHVMREMHNDFTVRDLIDTSEMEGTYSNYSNFQKLRYHGLVTPTRDGANNRIKGRWLITRNGWAFLRGTLTLPRYVLVRDNEIQERSEELIGVRDVYRGSEIVATTFEYFDEHGRPVGVRPVSPNVPDKRQPLF